MTVSWTAQCKADIIYMKQTTTSFIYVLSIILNNSSLGCWQITQPYAMITYTLSSAHADLLTMHLPHSDSMYLSIMALPLTLFVALCIVRDVFFTRFTAYMHPQYQRYLVTDLDVRQRPNQPPFHFLSLC